MERWSLKEGDVGIRENWPEEYEELPEGLIRDVKMVDCNTQFLNIAAKDERTVACNVVTRSKVYYTAPVVKIDQLIIEPVEGQVKSIMRQEEGYEDSQSSMSLVSDKYMDCEYKDQGRFGGKTLKCWEKQPPTGRAVFHPEKGFGMKRD